MVNVAAVIIRILTALSLIVLFGFHFADFALQCNEEGFGEQICNGTWFNNQFRLSSDYGITDEPAARPWYHDAFGITIFIVNFVLIAVAVVLVINTFLEFMSSRCMCILKSSYSIILFLFAVCVVINRGYINSPIAFATAGIFMFDAMVFED